MPRDLVTFTLASPRTLGIHSPDALCRVVTYAGFLLHFSSGIILVAIAASRYSKVTGSSMRGIGKLTRFVNTYRGARLTSVAVVVISSILTVPSLLLYKNNPDTPCFLQVQNQSSFPVSVSNCYLECALNTQSSHKVFAMIFLIFSLVVFSCIFVSLISLYLAVGYHLRELEKGQQPCSAHNPEALRNSRTDQQKSVEEETPSVSTEETDTTVHSSCTKRGYKSHQSTAEDGILHFPVAYNFNIISSAPPKPSEDIEKKECKSNMLDSFLPSVRDAKLKMTKTKKKTLMMMIITVIFILSYLPFLSLSIANQVTGGLCSKMSPDWLMTAEVFWRSFYISNAANPIVYGFCNPTFRKVLWKTLSWRAQII
ncbi:hypothetical protein C0Q70_07547 [Pomacea canaliculata]|uniref:G-protein coupled receptors family 1 profile domain-containing protein n=2 Tax=Pomacea canaliculata TaxID=400727 RepID=A0A2T7PFC0_POMCA|nr:hypothetical protein C0Q70_07547 [Pomacea canaliculata]